mgnify:CR=1 FL=1
MKEPYCHQETVFVHDDVTFNALHLLVAVNSVERTVVIPADALTVHDSHACFGFLTTLDTCFLAQVVQQQVKFVQGRPSAIIVINQFPRGKMEREHAPLATRFHEIENGTPYLTQIIFSLSFLQVQDFLDNLSLCFF